MRETVGNILILLIWAAFLVYGLWTVRVDLRREDREEEW
jgi:hypothetical protein